MNDDMYVEIKKLEDRIALLEAVAEAANEYLAYTTSGHSAYPWVMTVIWNLKNALKKAGYLK
jgi:hypothetical protein